jgi:hypothetical protein
VRAAILVVLVACGGGSGGGPTGPCSDLSLEDCRLTDGCEPDICATCFCSLAYRGCLSTFDTPEECPGLGCPGAECCSTADQCTNGGICTAPDAAEPCGGPCSTDPGDCAIDDDCAGSQICEAIACHCTGGASRCVSGCVDGVCPEGTTCDLATSRCQRTFCGVDEDCPPNFSCGDAGCLRKECTDDLECDGFCVLGDCFAGERGECRIPLP